MPHLPVLPPDQAPPESRVVYDEFHTRMAFPSAPNFIMTQGHSPTVARGTWEVVRNVLVSGLLPRWLKEMMFVAISDDRNCLYCKAAHIACCRMLGVKPDALNQLVHDYKSIVDIKTRDIVTFGVKCARDPQGISDADYAVLRGHGLSASEIMEVIAMSALAVYANILADATAMEADPMFDTI
jgi:uncharacterized peroxidase-related enzyme